MFWFLLLYVPYAIAINVIFLYLHFKITFYSLKNWQRPPHEASTSEKLGFFMMTLLNMTYVFIILFFFYMFSIPHKRFPMRSFDNIVCGPFSEKSELVTQYFAKGLRDLAPNVYNFFITVFFSWYFIYFFFFWLIFAIYIHSVKGKRLSEEWVKKQVVYRDYVRRTQREAKATQVSILPSK